MATQRITTVTPTLIPVVYLRNICTIVSAAAALAETPPAWYTAALAALNADGIPYRVWPRGGGIVCEGATFHLNGQVCMYAIVYPGARFSRDCCIGSGTEVYGSVLGHAETEGGEGGHVTIHAGGVIAGRARISGTVEIGPHGTVCEYGSVEAKSRIVVEDGVIRTALVTDYVTGQKHRPVPYCIAGAHGDFEVKGGVKIASAKGLQAYYDAITARNGSLGV